MATRGGNTSRRTSTKKAAGPKEISSEELQRKLKSLLEQEPKTAVTSALTSVGLRSPVILFGEQHLRARRIIDWIREQFFPESSADYIAYFGTELSSKKALEPLVQVLHSPSLFAKQTLVVIYDSDSVKAAAAKELAELLQTPAPDVLVLLTSEDSSKKTSVAGLLGAQASRVSLSELKGTALVRWAEREAKRLGAGGFEAGAVELLVQYFGSDTTQLTREIEKLALLSPSESAISKDLVRQLSFHSPDVTSFELMQRIARRDVTAASVLALHLVDQGMHPMQISFFVSRCMRTMLARRAAKGSDELAAEFNNYWFTKNLSGLERNFSEAEVSLCLEQLRLLDFNLKDSKLNERMALSLCVQKLAGRSQALEEVR